MNHPKACSPGTILVLVGTKRGLFLLTSRDRETWEVETTALKGTSHFLRGSRSAQRPAAVRSRKRRLFGSFLRYSDDFGQTWHDQEDGIRFPEEGQQKLENIWTIVPGRPNEAGTVYAGIDPASLWVSTDGGVHWEINAGLANHPTRDQWQPGAGGLCLHTIVADPSNASRMWVGISAVGCMRTDDGGQSWVFANKNTRADFLPEKYPEFGSAFTALCSIRRNRTCSTSKTTAASIKVRTRAMIGSIFKTICPPSLAFLLHWTLTTQKPCS